MESSTSTVWLPSYFTSMSSFSSDGQDDFFESEEEREQEQERAQRAWWGQAQRQPVGSDPRVSAELNYAYALTHGAQTFSDSSLHTRLVVIVCAT